MNLRRSCQILLPALAATLLLPACQTTRNFTTYYNLFYNMERIMGEVEEELLYIREQKSPEPVYFVPYDDLERRDNKYYAHLERRSMNNEETRANKVKLDSILIKGSKLMARNARSDYLPDAVFYIGKTYFYEREWYQSQKKCEELIASFPNSPWYPDAHLVAAMDMMWQGKVADAATMLSRTIDVGWARERKDILIDAFRLNADLQIGEGNVADALKPYERALVLSTDDEDRARWQYEIGMIHFRRGDFQQALAAFDVVGDKYSPDVLTQFETGMQRAATLRALGKYDEAGSQLSKLRRNGNYEGWYGLVELEMMNLAAARPDGHPTTDADLARVDSVSPGKSYSSYAIYEHAVRAFRAGDFSTALEGFNKVKTNNVPFNRRAARYATQLQRYFEQSGKGFTLIQGYDPAAYPDSSKGVVADAFYNTARVFAALDMPDSMMRYYNLSYTWSAPASPEGARVLYARSVMSREAGRSSAADSILGIIADRYPLTDYAVEARRALGYTEAAKIDTAEDHYVAGVHLMNHGQDRDAMREFLRVITNSPTSPYVARSYYAIGLIYEQHLDMLDSAYSYYGMLIDRFPHSEQALSVAPLLQAVNTQRMRRPNQLPGGDSTGLQMDWMKQNPPVDPGDDGDDALIPLNGDTTRMHRPNGNPANQKQPAVKPPPGTQPAGNQPATGQPATGQPSGPQPSGGGGTTGGKPATGTTPPGTGSGVPATGATPAGGNPPKPAGSKPDPTPPKKPTLPPKHG